ncbi:unnamed protein product [Ambrosiozyma monospora]|uniref:Unnamed protein product n=1 Tax=Ambrosiozyma monospora TaxID=43982 RepID=A0ACB5T096_AMBMO|nr:unnamed protein product [Ambrosiozyma monospora]
MFMTVRKREMFQGAKTTQIPEDSRFTIDPSIVVERAKIDKHLLDFFKKQLESNTRRFLSPEQLDAVAAGFKLAFFDDFGTVYKFTTSQITQIIAVYGLAFHFGTVRRCPVIYIVCSPNQRGPTGRVICGVKFGIHIDLATDTCYLRVVTKDKTHNHSIDATIAKTKPLFVYEIDYRNESLVKQSITVDLAEHPEFQLPLLENTKGIGLKTYLKQLIRSCKQSMFTNRELENIKAAFKKAFYDDVSKIYRLTVSQVAQIMVVYGRCFHLDTSRGSRTVYLICAPNKQGSGHKMDPCGLRFGLYIDHEHQVLYLKVLDTNLGKDHNHSFEQLVKKLKNLEISAIFKGFQKSGVYRSPDDHEFRERLLELTVPVEVPEDPTFELPIKGPTRGRQVMSSLDTLLGTASLDNMTPPQIRAAADTVKKVFFTEPDKIFRFTKSQIGQVLYFTQNWLSIGCNPANWAMSMICAPNARRGPRMPFMVEQCSMRFGLYFDYAHDFFFVRLLESADDSEHTHSFSLCMAKSGLRVLDNGDYAVCANNFLDEKMKLKKTWSLTEKFRLRKERVNKKRQSEPDVRFEDAEGSSADVGMDENDVSESIQDDFDDDIDKDNGDETNDSEASIAEIDNYDDIMKVEEDEKVKMEIDNDVDVDSEVENQLKEEDEDDVFPKKEDDSDMDMDIDEQNDELGSLVDEEHDGSVIGNHNNDDANSMENQFEGGSELPDIYDDDFGPDSQNDEGQDSDPDEYQNRVVKEEVAMPTEISRNKKPTRRPTTQNSKPVIRLSSNRKHDVPPSSTDESDSDIESDSYDDNVRVSAKKNTHKPARRPKNKVPEDTTTRKSSANKHNLTKNTVESDNNSEFEPDSGSDADSEKESLKNVFNSTSNFKARKPARRPTSGTPDGRRLSRGRSDSVSRDTADDGNGYDFDEDSDDDLLLPSSEDSDLEDESEDEDRVSGSSRARRENLYQNYL